MQKFKLILIAIILLAGCLRFYQLGKNPPSLNWDETAHGYNAYSILKTGMDEYGYKFPLSFRSFDDYKPPLYTYLVVPSIVVFGLNDFAVRFPSALLGTFAVLGVYLMVFELFKKRKIALTAALFFAISPWHIQFSRVAFETNSSIFFMVFGTWAYLVGINKKKKSFALWITLAATFFGLGMFVYHNARVFLPIYSLMLLFLYRKQLFQNKKYLVLPTVVTGIFIVLLIPIIFSIAGQFRFKATSIFSLQAPRYNASDQIEVDREEGVLWQGKLFHNRRIVYVPILVDNYLSNFRLNYLLFNADLERHHAPEMGLLYLWDIPFIICGIYFLIKKDFDLKTKVIIFWWFLIAPVAASVTWGVPHSLRSEIYLPTYQIFASIGFLSLLQLTKHKKLFLGITVILLALNFLIYLRQYYVYLPKEYSKSWIYGRKEAALFTESIKDQYKRVIVSTNLEQPHEYWLYYLKYDPKKYLQDGGTVSGGFLEDRNKFDKYLFKPIKFDEQKEEEPNTLFVGKPDDFPPGVLVLKQINYLNGEPAILIVGR